ncbi:MAG TPA: prenyltransferase/squalene oxidase repeat-containing protein, partial [Gemmataceae bacterium]|nr:prenyltransferase/squalene oxidase repeat-containing protein [Gemmataceae bacterium]
MPQVTTEALESAYQTALAALLAERHPNGYWVGELSTSALSTATAVAALSLLKKDLRHQEHDALIQGGLAWLVANQNEDGGWGDTIKSFSNISTTMLCRAAFHISGTLHAPSLTLRAGESVSKAEKWLAERHGKTPEELAEAVRARYGKDRTFAVPILTTCALAGLVSWKEVQALPFELACFPQAWFRFLRLHVVSYALPALIAIGQAVFHHRKPWNPITRVIRALSRKRSLRVLERIQPSSGGFLEATPLTSFVTLSLAACGLADHPVARKGVQFLVNSVRPDGSWPIDTNLSTWVTTLSVNALAASTDLDEIKSKEKLTAWLTAQQYKVRHPYTGAAPGGWAWTPLSGGVPDADDSPGALLALSHLGCNMNDAAIEAGLNWLFKLQNRDGGWPTFCRGWGFLPFDRSGCDLTAHATRAICSWARIRKVSIYTEFNVKPRLGEMTPNQRRLFWKLFWSIPHAVNYLAKTQRPDGSWLPLWFGNQHAPDDENPTYGTARVLAAYRDLDMMNSVPARRGITWLVGIQNADGGWGGAAKTPSSIEETALAVEILLDAGPDAAEAVNKGLAW